ncbi:MAG: hypothetical protein JKY03_07280 [Aureispira sp.]|nr:hypothetical protein [Aureispira sp.]
MKKLFMLILLSFIFFSSNAQGDSYSNDAVQLAARLVVNQATGEISEHLIYSIEDALIAVAQSPYVSANAVAHRYQIHTSPTVNVKNARIILGKEATWSQDISENPIQKILPNYKFTLEVIETTDTYVVLNFASEKTLNMKFIANEISYLNNVWMVELPTIILNKDDIQLKEIEGGYLLTYVYHTGSSEGDYGETHYWNFEVKHNGNVKFLGEHGADLAVNSQDTEKSFFTLLNEQRP